MLNIKEEEFSIVKDGNNYKIIYERLFPNPELAKGFIKALIQMNQKSSGTLTKNCDKCKMPLYWDRDNKTMKETGSWVGTDKKAHTVAHCFEMIERKGAEKVATEEFRDFEPLGDGVPAKSRGTDFDYLNRY